MEKHVKWLLVATLAGVAAAALVWTGVFMTGVVLAGHTFTDVPTSAFYHNAVEWVFNRGITAGCAPSLYCPDANVTRGQMAVFLQKLGQAVTPITLTAGVAAGGALDPDANPVVCPTGDHTPTFPQRAYYQNLLNSRRSVTAGGPPNISDIPVYSTDSGITWTAIPTPAGVTPTVRPDQVGENVPAFAVSAFASLDLMQGTSYRFGLRVSRRDTATTDDLAAHECVVHVEILNRNPATSPLAPKP